MASTTIAPYTLTTFGEIPEGTVFVDAGEYANTQEELPLELNWQQVYQDIIKPASDKRLRLYSALAGSICDWVQAVKYRDWGCHLNAKVNSHFDTTDAVITGPLLSDLPEFGGLLRKDDIKIINRLELAAHHQASHSELQAAISRLTLASTIAAELDAVKRLEKAGLVYQSGKLIYLSNLGLLRCLQDRVKAES